jgi:hypothetical protein
MQRMKTLFSKHLQDLPKREPREIMELEAEVAVA